MMATPPGNTPATDIVLSRQARAAVAAACHRAGEAVQNALRVNAGAQQAQQIAQARCRASMTQRIRRCRGRRFLLVGSVAGQEVLAAYGSSGLVAHPELVHRADLVVRMGETVEPVRGRPTPASLDGPPVVVLLTLMRACDAIRSCELDLLALASGHDGDTTDGGGLNRPPAGCGTGSAAGR